MGLGALGIGLPDIVIFTGLVLKGQYELALHYGFSYDRDDEKRFLLLLIRCMSKELLYMKFLQGIPIVGAVGGVHDYIYMKRIMKYADLKYRHRFYTVQIQKRRR